ncbi:MAG: sulfotransferase family 2 domain-containing protein [Acidimicrobiales bacterium]
MIISHEHSFIFIKTHKTAGSSIEAALSPHVGDDAVVTQLLPDEPPEHNSRNHRGLFNPIPDVVAAFRAGHDRPRRRGAGVFEPLLRLRRRQRYWEHMSLGAALRHSPREVGSYYRFCFERNPWDKVLSIWFWSGRQAGRQRTMDGFERWLDMPDTPRGLRSDWHLYSLGGKLAVDFVGRFEDLEQDLRVAMRPCGVDTSILEIPHHKKAPRSPDVQISQRASRRIEEMFHREIEAFGYEPPSGLIA